MYLKIQISPFCMVLQNRGLFKSYANVCFGSFKETSGIMQGNNTLRMGNNKLVGMRFL